MPKLNRSEYQRFFESEEIHSICVLAWGLLGDAFIRVPIIEALRERYPNAYIAAVVDPVAEVALRLHPAINEVIVFHRKKKPRYRYIRSLVYTLARIRRKKFDLSVNLYSGGSSPLYTRLMGAKYRLGFDHTRALRRANNVLVEHPNWCRQWIRQFASVLQPLGIDPDSVRIGSSFYLDDVARKAVTQWQPPKQAYIVINLATGQLPKCWPVERYVSLCEQIIKQYGLFPVVLTNPGQESLAKEFSTRAKFEFINPPVLPLDQVGALMEGAEFVITGDTSLMHASFGLHRPTLVLFTYTRPEWHIVQDCPLEYCFIEDPAVVHELCHMVMGTKDIPVGYVLEKFTNLYRKVKRD